MSISYKKLLHLMIEKDISNIQLKEMCGFSGNIMTRVKKSQYISLETIEAICKNLKCGVDDILEFIEIDD